MILWHIQFVTSLATLFIYQIIFMGQSQKPPPLSAKEELAINNDEWQQIRYEPTRRILENLRTNLEAEYQLIKLDPMFSVDHQLDIYLYRKHQDSALVKTYGAEHLKNTQGPLCGNTQTLKVITERIPRRLSELPQLILPEALYFLSEAYRGYKDCFEKVGIFEVTDSMMGVNHEGEVRVWLNQNFAHNHPSNERPDLQITSTSEYRTAAELVQKTMVQNVTKVIQAKTENGSFPPDFKQAIYEQPTFADAYCQIENYIQSKNIWIPDRLPSNSLISQNRKQQSKIADFKSYLKERPESQLAYQTLQKEPHARYVPNVQYSDPRITYVDNLSSPKSDSSHHIRPRTIQVNFQKNPNQDSIASHNTLKLNSYHGDFPREKLQYKSFDEPNVFTYRTGGSQATPNQHNNMENFLKIKGSGVHQRK